MIVLSVTNAFGEHARGDRIEEAAEIAAILACANVANVVKVLAPDPDPIEP